MLKYQVHNSMILDQVIREDSCKYYSFDIECFYFFGGYYGNEKR